VHLDDDEPAGTRVHGELDVAAPGVHPDLAQHRDAEVTHPLVLPVGERHRRRHGDGIAGVHAHRVDVLDGADHDHVVPPVAHEFELVLLPAEHALLDEHLVHGGRGEPAVRPPRVASSASGRSFAMTSSTNSGVIGSMYVASANSGSVMMVAGLELTSVTRNPSARRTRHAWVPE